MTFEETGLRPEILKALGEIGFESPTPIQEKTIPHLLNTDKDLIALAQTGTGKTAAFGLPVLHLSDTEFNSTQAIVLCPTRELCLQIYRDLDSFAKYMKGLDVVAVYGGDSIDKQIKALRRGGHIVVGTPGRVNDLIRRKRLDLSSVRTLVLDEADEMLNMGFKDELDSILSAMPEERQTLLFSATMPKEISRIAKNYMDTPDEIAVGKKNEGADTVTHEYYMVNARDKYPALKRLVDINPNVYGIVFCRTRAETKEIANKLVHDGYNADALHGDLSQAQREQVMNKFRIKHLQLLVATDVAARGLDVDNLTHVINFNLPDDPEAYVHRSGRTGRAGKKGISLAIIHTRETGRIRQIERMMSKKFDHKQVPNGKEVCSKQLFNLIDKIENIEVNEEQIEQFMPDIYKKLEWLSREELIKHFVSAEFNRFLTYYEDAPDLNVTSRGRDNDRGRGRDGRSRDRDRGRDRDDRGRGRDRGGDFDRDDRKSNNYSRFFINIGSKDEFSPTNLIGLINDQPSVSQVGVGKIEILKKFSFFEVDKQYEKDIIDAFQGVNYNGIDVSVEPSNPKPSARDRGGDRGGYSGGGRRRSSGGGYSGGGDRGGRRRRSSNSKY
ncbi:DEAD/DEAH box helicase [Flammeovirgaceae bacterium SG7u.111]|nr:DEAD/DEAH box helicase [Flammeovirgaceae bacterium SG7u.132]WPO33414.1 DEAD/DEAH box helicase [Flammeovirgaceae bacterium SG7u.111]